MAECLGKWPTFVILERPWSPSSSTILLQQHFVLSKILALVQRVITIRSSSGLRRFPMLAFGNASDQAAVCLSYAVSNQQWFQGLLVLSRVLSESLQARSSQADCIPFCSGNESWCLDQVKLASFTSP